MPFRYLRDRLFLICVAAYIVNRFVFKKVWTGGFVHDHFNDLICIPFWVPIMLWMERRLGMRRHDGPPEAVEVVVPLLIWSWAFEVLLPSTGWLGTRFVADPRDVMWYSVGALGAALAWRWTYGDGPAAGDAAATAGSPQEGHAVR